MAALAYQQAALGGTALTFASATGGAGDTVPADDRGMLIVRNGSGSAITATVVTPGSTEYGVSQPDVQSVSIPATTGVAVIGPFPGGLKDPADGLVHITYSAVTTVTVAAVRV